MAASEPRTSDRRVHMRLPVRMLAALYDDTIPGEIGFLTHDLSLGGVFLESDLLFDVGSVLILLFELDGERHRVGGYVVWNRADPDTGTPGMGVRFTDMSTATREALRRFLEAKLSEAGAA